MLGIKPRRTSCVPGKRSTTERYHQPFISFQQLLCLWIVLLWTSVYLSMWRKAFSSLWCVPRNRDAELYSNCPTIRGTVRLFPTVAYERSNFSAPILSYNYHFAILTLVGVIYRWHDFHTCCVTTSSFVWDELIHLDPLEQLVLNIPSVCTDNPADSLWSRINCQSVRTSSMKCLLQSGTNILKSGWCHIARRAPQWKG